MASPLKLETRVAALESELARLKQRLNVDDERDDSWLEAAYGAFANDPIYDEAMRLGKQYRTSLRPKTAKRKSRKPAATRKRA